MAWTVLIEPDGISTGIILHEEFAIKFCERHTGWTYKALPDKAAEQPDPSKFTPEKSTTKTRKKKS